MANPYNIDFLKGLIGQQESQRLEFKSSRELSNDNVSKQNKFMMEQVIPAVSVSRGILTSRARGLLAKTQKTRHGRALPLQVPDTRIDRRRLSLSAAPRIACAGLIRQ